MTMHIAEQGAQYPLGSLPTTRGVNFALFSEHAERVVLCLYDDQGQSELQQIELQKGEAHVWSIFVKGLSAGARYGYRVYGPYQPEQGLRFNPNKLLIDPYARALDREFEWSDAAYDFTVDDSGDAVFSELDHAATQPKSVVCKRKTAAEIEKIQKKKPRIPWPETLVYELHAKGFTQLQMQLPESIRGTFAGLAHADTIAYFKDLGVTTIELLPIHSFIDEAFLIDKNLSNYWGYNTLNFFSLQLGYLSTGSADEFFQCVDAYHRAGLEIILDVVYNHTAESGDSGPCLSFKGIDNPNYYRLDKSNAATYINDTGCGNTVRAEHPRVLQLILDSLRYWAGEMGVDGFRFDLASVLGRDEDGFQLNGAFFQAVSQDPLLSTCKMIAEPWDIGPGGYQLGNYPPWWSEWNDKYRDAIRRFWRGERGLLPEFVRRIHGSSELFEHRGSGPRTSVNFVCSHDGFTLRDLVCYNDRHNDANGENSQDGHHSNFSDNYGVEGPTDDIDIEFTRRKQQRNFLVTLLLAQGTPMLLGGDELGRTQEGNNNAYCQDNELNWFKWSELDAENNSLLAFVKKVINIRREMSPFFADQYIHSIPDDALGRSSKWFACNGEEMENHDWHGPSRTIAWLLEDRTERKKDYLLMIFNADTNDMEFTLPRLHFRNEWKVLLDTYSETGVPTNTKMKAHARFLMPARSTMVLTLSKRK